MDPITLAAGAVGLIGGIGSLFGGNKAKKELRRLGEQDPTYQTSPYAKQRLDYAQTILNARMPGAGSAERNIFANQASGLANVNRNATDSSTALAAAAGLQGQSNQAFQDLGQQEAQDYYRRLENLNSAQQGMISENDKAYQDQVRRFDNKVALAGARNQINQSSWQSISNLGFAGMNFGMAGGFNGLLGGGSSSMPQNINTGNLRPSTSMQTVKMY